jgi:uncharacterized protein YacL
MAISTTGSEDTKRTAFYIVRALFVLLFTFTSWRLGESIEKSLGAAGPAEAGQLAGIILGVAVSILLVAFESYYARYYLSLFYSIIAGLCFGLLVSVFFVQVVGYIPEQFLEGVETRAIIALLVTTCCCYLSVILVLRARNKYRLVIPFIELKREGPQRKRLILDTSAIIDGRIVDVAETMIIDQPLFLPDFVLQDIHRIADHADAVKRTRGRRALDLLNRLRTNSQIEIELFSTSYPEDVPTDSKLVQLAREINGRILTTDNSLHKLSQLQGIDVINMHELENALRPILLVGEQRPLKIIRQGEEADQGVGYLEDGTMVVVKHGRKYLGRECVVAVTSVYQRQTGRMIFAEAVGASEADDGDDAPRDDTSRRRDGDGRTDADESDDGDDDGDDGADDDDNAPNGSRQSPGRRNRRNKSGRRRRR